LCVPDRIACKLQAYMNTSVFIARASIRAQVAWSQRFGVPGWWNRVWSIW